MLSRPFAMTPNALSLAVLACCSFLALVACEHQPMPGVNPTPSSAPQAPPPPGTTGAAGTTVDVTTTTITETAEPTAGGGEVVEVDETQTQVQETVPAVSSAQREADMADCYAFARSQVQHDINVQDDSATVVDSTVNPGYTVFTQELTDYGNEKRRGELFDNCMAAKGYAADGY
jgi:hypothetical protein